MARPPRARTVMATGGNPGTVCLQVEKSAETRAGRMVFISMPARARTEPEAGHVADAGTIVADDRCLPALPVLRLGGSSSACRFGGRPRRTGLRRPQRTAI